MKLIIRPGPSCPRCKAPEVANPEAPILEQRVNVRAFKVNHSGSWWSECMRCKERGLPSWFNKRGQFETPR